MQKWLLILLFCLVGCTSAPIECKNDDCFEGDMMTAHMWAQGGILTPGGGGLLRLQQEKLQPGNYLVQFDMIDPNPDSGLGSASAKATIRWSINGIPTQRIIDVVRGATIAGIAEAVDITVQDTTLNGSGPTRPYNVMIRLAPGTRSPVQQPPTLSSGPLLDLLPNSTTGVLVPDNSGAISVFVALAPALGVAVNAYDVQVWQVDGGGNVLKAYDPRQSDWVPLAPGTSSVKVVSSAAAPELSIQITFGIDG